MGVRGLTTFINNRSHLYLKEYELHDCKVILDGNSIASNLYKWHCKSNDCFGGDYDKFANVIYNFFNLLSHCNIVPYVILDGGYEKRKLATVISRMKNKIRSAGALNAVTEGSESVFPLFLREVFVDVVLSLGLKVARCEFEGDMEIAGIAKTLGCPVISYDSDFYIFGCDYIPFSTVELTARKGNDKSSKTSYNYLSCKIYHIDNFLKAFGGLDKNNLPLLAVVLGNDYVKGTLFRPFFRNLKIQKCNNNQSDQQKRIKSVIVWLQNENVESAIRTILGRFKDHKRRLVLRKIRQAMNGYFEINSELLEYLEIEPKSQEDNVIIDFDELDAKVPISEENEDETSSESDDASSENDLELDIESDTIEQFIDNNIENETKIFHENYQKCQYPSCFMDMITLNKYYCIPQVEDSSLEHSHTISFEILSAIHKILTGGGKQLTIVARKGKGSVKFSCLPKSNLICPTLENIIHLTLEERQQALVNILEINNDFFEVLSSFPIEWHLFLLSLKYALSKGNFDQASIFSCIICFIVLNYVDSKVGFHRVSKTFDKKFASFLQQNKSTNKNSSFESFENLPYVDCMFFMDKVISSFQMDIKLKTNYRLYDKVLVHSLSQIQSVFLHVKYLNSLLDNCYPPLQIHKIFDGTFIYNMTSNLQKRSSISDYLELLLKDCPLIFRTLTYVFELLEKHFKCDVNISKIVKKHRKKKRKKSEDAVCDLNISTDEEIDLLLDPNNPYSLLAALKT